MSDYKFKVGRTYKRRDGKDVKLVHRHMNCSYDCLVWVVDGESGSYPTNEDGRHFQPQRVLGFSCRYTSYPTNEDGRHFQAEEMVSKFDVMPPMQSGELVLNIYPSISGERADSYATVDGAKANQAEGIIARVKVQWEEGQFDD